MTRTLHPPSTVTPAQRRRLWLTPALLAVAALALTACGTERTNAGASRDRPADAADARPVSVPPSPDQEVAFVRMLDTVARPCFPDTPPEHEASADEEAERPPTAPVEALPIDTAPPAGAGPAPGESAAPHDTELSAVEKCVGRLHAERITQALGEVKEPAPAEVREILNQLGYIDQRIHGLKESGTGSQFILDLRFMGSGLCLEASVNGTETTIEPFGSPETGAIPTAGRER
ncbi:hypothetical protein ACFXAZ_06790 [Streptomyces sp. NPDC059477]|uniref:hypothetical protein n=1 Tax=Streptomyces sp. NPDC059477 TaxID=3346847 RepID=UPI0036C3417A